MAKKLTPMMEQYYSIKQQAKDALLFFRLGDFYEMFGDDAVLASKLLDITLTKRHKDSDVHLAGVPYHAAGSYITKLVNLGYNVAICEQVEDPKLAKGIVKREIIRTITPGTIIDTSGISEKNNNFLMAITMLNGVYGISYVDIGTGEFYVKEYQVENGIDNIINEIIRIDPAEIILDIELYENVHFLSSVNKVLSHKAKRFLNYVYIKDVEKDIILEHFNVHNLDGYGIENKNAIIRSSAIIIDYIRETQRSQLSHINRIQFQSTAETMIIDRSTQLNLELVKNNAGDKKGSLLWIMDKTKTNMGARLLKKYILNPLLNIDEIKKRQNIVEQLTKNIMFQDELSQLLSSVTDIERCIARLVYGSANARDLLMLRSSLEIIPSIKRLCSQSYIGELTSKMNDLNEIVELINNSILEDPPITIKDGKIIKEGFNSELDEIKKMVFSGKEWLKELETREKELTGIKNLKVKYNSVFGYYIEVTKSNLNMVPDRYIRKQTLTNCERYFTPELKEKESIIIGSNERMCNLEYKIFNEIRSEVLKETVEIQNIASILAQLDVFLCFSEIAVENNYCKPQIDDSKKLSIINGRHPVVEKMNSNESFVPNDTYLDIKTHQLIILTGPNMAGKSTYIRQVAILTLMAQIGSFIPATEAVIGVVDRIFTRVGASDNLFMGLSTFMVEMNETANILNNATEKSLIILDEIGRGTSTFDGLSLAWSIAEYIHNYEKLRAKTMFATHYHELTELSSVLKRVKNYNIAVKEKDGQIVFLRKIVKGGADKSYGIHVAELAGLPKVVVNRANEILNIIETGNSSDMDNNKEFIPLKRRSKIISPGQLSLFNVNNISLPEKVVENNKYDKIIKELMLIDINTTTPMEAIMKLYKLQQKVKKNG